MIDFSSKITNKRPFNTKERKSLDGLIYDVESDRGRIINSAAVRRLQQKTQVFPLEKNSAVRSRLTHSLEVQQVGRYIVQTIFRNLPEKLQKEYKIDGLERHIESMVEMSCLLHDVGNPPFGHFGEQAINDWFEKNLANSLPVINDKALDLDKALVKDICGFEGNAQAIRLVDSLLQLNLTYSQVAGILKYTRCGTADKPKKTDQLSYLKKKVGYYFSEQSYVEMLCDELNIEVGNRHPISYIMEAADDISYCIADIEDAVEKGIIDVARLSVLLTDEFKSVLKEFEIQPGKLDMTAILSNAHEQSKIDDICADSQFFTWLRVGVITPLVNHAAKCFIENIHQVYQGSFNCALLEDKSHAHAMTQSLKNVAFKHVFCHKEVESRELQGYTIITGLLDCYQPLLKLTRQAFELVMQQDKDAPLLEKRLFKKLPDKHVRAYTKATNKSSVYNADMHEFYYRCRLMQDYISGMTDQFAYDEFRMMKVAD